MKSFPFLSINAENNYLPVVTSFVENYCKSVNFPASESKSLILITEEIFTYLCNINSGCGIKLTCIYKKYKIELDWRFSAKNFNPRAFNITYSVDPENDSSLQEMGLMIANRISDNFKISLENDEIVISVSKLKNYRSSENEYDYKPKTNEKYKIINPDKQQMILLSLLISGYENNKQLPGYLLNNYLLADLYDENEIFAKVITGENGLVAGGIIWKKYGLETVEMEGPFLADLSDNEQTAIRLVESCIESIGKENIKGLICINRGRYFPESYFEVIGTKGENKIYFREMHEDSGSVAWVNKGIKSFLEKKYSELFLPREIITVPDNDYTNEKYSVISSGLQRSSDSVYMSPMLFGQDFTENLKEHLNFFIQESYKEIFFETDLGINDHSYFVPGLLKNNFTPVCIIPCGGKGDLLLFRYSENIVTGE